MHFATSRNRFLDRFGHPRLQLRRTYLLPYRPPQRRPFAQRKDVARGNIHQQNPLLAIHADNPFGHAVDHVLQAISLPEQSRELQAYRSFSTFQYGGHVRQHGVTFGRQRRVKHALFRLEQRRMHFVQRTTNSPRLPPPHDRRKRSRQHTPHDNRQASRSRQQTPRPQQRQHDDHQHEQPQYLGPQIPPPQIVPHTHRLRSRQDVAGRARGASPIP